jgi:hypothetical protein
MPLKINTFPRRTHCMSFTAFVYGFSSTDLSSTAKSVTAKPPLATSLEVPDAYVSLRQSEDRIGHRLAP